MTVVKLAPGERFLRMPEVVGMTGYKRSMIYRMITLGQFPAQRQLSSNCVVWLESEVRDWMQRKLDAA